MVAEDNVLKGYIASTFRIVAGTTYHITQCHSPEDHKNMNLRPVTTSNVTGLNLSTQLECTTSC
jgi:hypothetical protein